MDEMFDLDFCISLSWYEQMEVMKSHTILSFPRNMRFLIQCNEQQNALTQRTQNGWSPILSFEQASAEEFSFSDHKFLGECKTVDDLVVAICAFYSAS